jgi:hypothetical protein
MTKVQIQFALARALDEPLLERIETLHGVYGLNRIEIAPSLDALTVDYDATRMNPREVEAVLRGAGLPITRQDHA